MGPDASNQKLIKRPFRITVCDPVTMGFVQTGMSGMMVPIKSHSAIETLRLGS
jgi:hypothetical protein